MQVRRSGRQVLRDWQPRLRPSSSKRVFRGVRAPPDEESRMEGGKERKGTEATGRRRGQTTRGFRSRLTAEFPHKLLVKFADKYRNIL